MLSLKNASRNNITKLAPRTTSNSYQKSSYQTTKFAQTKTDFLKDREGSAAKNGI